jgi:hypothetical protein
MRKYWIYASAVCAITISGIGNAAPTQINNWYIGGIAGKSIGAPVYTGGELRLESSLSKLKWFGFGAGILFLNNNPNRNFLRYSSVGGIEFSIKKRYNVKPIDRYKAFSPIFGVGLFVYYSSTEREDNGSEYKTIEGISLRSISPNVAVLIPLTNQFSIVPSMRVIVPLQETHGALFTIGAAISYEWE